jgi:hypothetical protein
MTCSGINDTNGVCGTLESAGTGLGTFLSAIQSPLVAFALVFGIIGGIVAIFLAVGTMIRKTVVGHKYK